jgi:hypothetical protein
MLYSIFTADLPETEQTLTATYANDTAILASHQNPITASKKKNFRIILTSSKYGSNVSV